MGSIRSINGRRVARGAGELDGSPITPGGLLEAIDEHTRQLLGRRTGSRRERLITRALRIADMLGLAVAFAVAALVWPGHGVSDSASELTLFALALPCWMLAATLDGLYRGDRMRRRPAIVEDVVGSLRLLTIGAWLVLVVSRLGGSDRPGVLVVAGFWALALLTVPAARAAARAACWRTVGFEQNTVIVGAGEVGQLICRELLAHPEYGANVVGFVDRAPRVRRHDLPERLSVLGSPDRLPEIIERLGVERVVISFSREPVSELLALVRRLQPMNVRIDVVPRLYELMGPQATLRSVAGVPLIGLPAHRPSTASRTLRRTIDVVGASVALIVCSPLIAYIAARIRRESPGPVFIRRNRPGPDAEEFTAVEFRATRVLDDPERETGRASMSITAVSGTVGLYQLARIEPVTEIGRWLRRTGLDGLPHLLNVLSGDIPLSGVWNRRRSRD